MADIPASSKARQRAERALGLRFLRHIERNSLLLFMVLGDTDDIKRECEILLDELRRFNPELLDKPRLLAVTKCDLLDGELIEMLREELTHTVPLRPPRGDSNVLHGNEAPSGADGRLLSSLSPPSPASAWTS